MWTASHHHVRPHHRIEGVLLVALGAVLAVPGIRAPALVLIALGLTLLMVDALDRH